MNTKLSCLGITIMVFSIVGDNIYAMFPATVAVNILAICELFEVKL